MREVMKDSPTAAEAGPGFGLLFIFKRVINKVSFISKHKLNQEIKKRRTNDHSQDKDNWNKAVKTMVVFIDFYDFHKLQLPFEIVWHAAVGFFTSALYVI